MNIINLKNNLKTITDQMGYSLYFGSISNFNSNRNVEEKTLLIEPLKNIPINTKGDCKTKLRLGIWLIVTKPKDKTVLNSEGYNLNSQQEMLDDANTLYNLMLKSNFITPLISDYNLTSDFYDINNNKVVNDQMMLNINLEVEVYEV